MQRTIDGDKLKNIFTEWLENYIRHSQTDYDRGKRDIMQEVVKRVLMAPTVDAPVTHGHWECGIWTDKGGGSISYYKCSLCGQECVCEHKPNYCFNCGARMDGKNADN